tara:strand:+ start:1108 stop:1350 length:243 start_codon:yes stop_codon:yes gene_type:complete
MLGASLLKGMLKPLLPKLEGYLRNHQDLKDGERSKIMLDLVDNKIHIQVIALQIKKKDQERKSDEYVITKVLQDIDPKEL